MSALTPEQQAVQTLEELGRSRVNAVTRPDLIERLATAVRIVEGNRDLLTDIGLLDTARQVLTVSRMQMHLRNAERVSDYVIPEADREAAHEDLIAAERDFVTVQAELTDRFRTLFDASTAPRSAPPPPERPEHLRNLDTALTGYNTPPWHTDIAGLDQVIADYEAIPETDTATRAPFEGMIAFARQLRDLMGIIGQQGQADVTRLTRAQRDQFINLTMEARNPAARRLLREFDLNEARQAELQDILTTQLAAIHNVREIRRLYDGRARLDATQTERLRERVATLARDCDATGPGDRVGLFMMGFTHDFDAQRLTRDQATEMLAAIDAFLTPRPPERSENFTAVTAAFTAYNAAPLEWNPPDAELVALTQAFGRLTAAERNEIGAGRCARFEEVAGQLHELNQLAGERRDRPVATLNVRQRNRLAFLLGEHNDRAAIMLRAMNFGGADDPRRVEVEGMIREHTQMLATVRAIRVAHAGHARTPLAAADIAVVQRQLAAVERVAAGELAQAFVVATAGTAAELDEATAERIIAEVRALRPAATPPPSPDSPEGRNARLRTFMNDNPGWFPEPAQMRTVYEIVGNPPVAGVLAGFGPDEAATITGAVERYAGYVTMVRELQQCAAIAEARFDEAVNMARPHVRAVPARMLPDIIHAVLGGNRAESDDLAEGILRMVNRTDLMPFVHPAFADPAGLSVQQIHTITSALDHDETFSSVRVMEPRGSGETWIRAIHAREDQITDAVRLLEGAIASGPADLSTLDATALGRLQDAIDVVGHTDENLRFAYAAYGRHDPLAPGELARLTHVRRAAPRRAAPPVPARPVPARPDREALPPPPPPHEPEHVDPPRMPERAPVPPAAHGTHDTHAAAPRMSPEQLRDYALGLLNNAVDNDIEVVPAAEIAVLQAALRPGVPGLTNGDRIALRPILERSIAARDAQHHFDDHPINTNDAFGANARELFEQFHHMDLEAMCARLEREDSPLDVPSFRAAYAQLEHVVHALEHFMAHPGEATFGEFNEAMGHLTHFYGAYINAPAPDPHHGAHGKVQARVDTPTERAFMRTALELLQRILEDMRRVQVTQGANWIRGRFRRQRSSLLQRSAGRNRLLQRHMNHATQQALTTITGLQNAPTLVLEGGAEQPARRYLAVRALSAMWRHKLRTLLVTGVLAGGGAGTYYGFKPAGEKAPETDTIPNVVDPNAANPVTTGAGGGTGTAAPTPKTGPTIPAGPAKGPPIRPKTGDKAPEK